MTSFFDLPEANALRELSKDGRLLIATRGLRLFAFGSLSVVLALYLQAIGFNEAQIGLVLAGTLAGDAALSLLVATHADRWGRRRMLMLSAGLAVITGLTLTLSRDPLVITLAAVAGTVSPTGFEVGPFLSIEQAALTGAIPDKHRTGVFAWYNLVAAFSTALGALFGGVMAGSLQNAGVAVAESYRANLIAYTALGIVMAGMFSLLSPAVEAARQSNGAGQKKGWMGLDRSRTVVLRLAGLFMLDSFGGGFIGQSLLAYWFHLRFGIDPATIGGVFFGLNLAFAASSLVAARLAERIGLVNTMVWTHLPSNILLLFVPLMPSLPLAAGLMIVRSMISNMDVPTRQSYLMAIVDPEERSAAAGVTSIARVAGSSVAPSIAGALLGLGWLGAPFWIAGVLKAGYDLILWRAFRAVRPPEEQIVEQTSKAA
jgi:MFS family permease